MLIIIIICLLYIKYPASIVCQTDFETGNITQSLMTWCECQELFCACPEQNRLPEVFKGKRGWDRGWIGVQHVYWKCEVIPGSLCSRVECSRIPAAVSEEQSENALEEMKAAVNLCQQCQGWGGYSLQSWEEHVFIIIRHPSAKKWIFLQDFYFCCLNQFWCNSWAFSALASKQFSVSLL